MIDAPAAYRRTGNFDPDFVLPRLLRTRAEQSPDRLFIQEVGGTQATYGEFDEQVRRWTTALSAAGIGSGDIVACLLHASADAVRAWMAIAWCGALEVPLNTGYNTDMVSFVLRDSQAKAVIASAETVAMIQGSLADLPALRMLVITDAAGEVTEIPPALAVLDQDDLARALPAGDMTAPAYWDPAAIVYTSGTSGVSKGVVCAWPKFYLDAAVGGLDELLGPDDAFYCVLPLFHISGKQAIYLSALFGGRLVLRRSFSAAAFLDEIRYYRASLTCVIMAIAHFVMAVPEREDDIANPLRYAIIAPMGEIGMAFGRRYGADVMSFYGQTEGCLPLITAWNPAALAAAGQPRPEVEVRIVDEHDEQVPIGVVGELIYRPKQPWTTMLSYLNRPDATAAAWRNGWFHTGDAFRHGSDGEYYFVDRRSDTIRRRGENVSSVELETMICKHPEVLECAAVAVPSGWGEDEIYVYLVLVPGATSSAEQLCEVLSESLPRFMHLSAVRVLTQLPRTPTGKVQKGLLRSRASAAAATATAVAP